MRTTPIRQLLMASVLAWLVAVASPARGQPAPTSLAVAPAAATAQPDAPAAPVSAARLLEVPIETSLDDARTRAENLTRQGNELLLARRSAEAETLYQQALALQASYDIAGNLGVAEIDAGKHRQAVEHLVFALRHFPVGASQEPLERLLRLIAKERAQVVMLVVEVNLAGAEVFVDDKPIGAAPLRDELFLEPGPRRVEARQKGYVTAEASVTGEIGTAWHVSLTLEREPPAASLIADRGSTSAARVRRGLATSLGRRQLVDDDRDVRRREDGAPVAPRAARASLAAVEALASEATSTCRSGSSPPLIGRRVGSRAPSCRGDAENVLTSTGQQLVVGHAARRATEAVMIAGGAACWRKLVGAEIGSEA